MNIVQSVERAFSILLTIGKNPEGIVAAEIAKSVNIPRPTVIRLLNTMQHVNAVERHPENATYKIGKSILALATNQSFSQKLINVARPFLTQLAQQTKETAYLSIPEGNFSHYIDQINSQFHIQPSDWIGRNVPMHLVSDGKIYLSTWEGDVLDNYISFMLETTPAYVKLTVKQLHKKLQTIQKQGFAHSRNEFEEGLIAFSAPIKSQAGETVAAVILDGPAYRFPEEKSDYFAKLVVEAGEAISKKL